ncbi:hypothetical protein SPRG_02703 [Saprolegnia parasitica CBS 223.65]|uniref:Uncharacterized protein n=1 Tax=Saprolegnia parasitica (strain CBS 223.65) TaxID=695850 RepID=A0A067CSL9_SAPPC|nr:hypothetical protein SPRG_02703 [Saprolegnia parasitica CBS 223.65]KDO32225.1 hypothetical protein SPRG_02703 [Saprolegnia parasitica CBS 223.65]|eukprot:XP_012196683.1 hypothetical protein SPRG_02703 [Saprolegnia parasitica CBS 223.65]
MATFCSVVLAQPAIASIIFKLQFGVYEDIASRFRDFNHLVDAYPMTETDDTPYYALDGTFVTSYRVDDDGLAAKGFGAGSLYLSNHVTRDARFPLHLAICEGDLRAAQRIVACRPDLVYQEAIQAALMTGHLEIADFLLQTHAVDRNYDDEFFGRISRPLDAWLPSALVRTNNADALALLWRHRQLQWSDNLLRAASFQYAPRAIAFLYQHMPQAVYDSFVDDAATLGLLEIVIDLVARGANCTLAALDAAAVNGHVGVVRFLIEHCHHAPSRWTLQNAAAKGHLAVVTYLHELGTLDDAVMAAFSAAYYGHDDVAHYLVANRRVVDTTVRVDAPVSDLVLIAMHLLSIRHTLEQTASYLSTLTKKRTSGVLEIAAFSIERGVVLEATWMIDACERGDMDVVVYLHEHGAASSPQAIDTAVRYNQWAIVDFLMVHRTEGATLAGIELALARGQFDLIARLWARQPELRDDDLLRVACIESNADAVHFLLKGGVGKPRHLFFDAFCVRRGCLGALLPYVLDAPTPVENLAFLVETFAGIANCISKSNLLVIKAEMPTTFKLGPPHSCGGAPRRRDYVMVGGC